MDEALDKVAYDSDPDLFIELITATGLRSYSAPTIISGDNIRLHNYTFYNNLDK